MDSATDQPPDGSTGAIFLVSPPSVETVATQTDRCGDVDFCYEEFYDASTLVEVPLTALDLGTEMDGDEFFNRTLDFEYEEVTLTRAGADQKVGLTLCYGSTCDEITDIFVGEVDPLGIAAKDGRIREGDQILQINGFDVHTRQEAVHMFSDSQTSITLLLARPAMQMDDGFMDIYNSLDDLRNRLDGMEDQTVLGPAPSNASSNQKNCFVDNSLNIEFQKLDRKAAPPLNDNVNYEHFIQKSHPYGGGGVKGSEFDRPAVDFSFTHHRSRSHDETAVDVDSEIDALNREMQRIQLQYQEIIDAARTTTATATACVDGGLCPANDHPTTAACSIADAIRSPRLVPRMGTRLDYIRQLHLASEHLSRATCSSSSSSAQSKCSPRRCSPAGRGVSEPDTSAYNTGESCRSTPAAPVESLRAADDRPDADDDGGATERANSSVNFAEETMKTGSGGERSRSRTSQTINGRIESLQRLYSQYIDVMYTNKANLQHTIMVQQNLFQQQLNRSNPPQNLKSSQSLSPGKNRSTKGVSGVTVGGDPGVAAQVPCPSGAAPQCGGELEWVVKRRADGSRYVTRRPIRNRILKERARKLAEERCCLTTDDDDISELKIGRYWSREERKKHLEKARNHRRQKDLLRQQMDNIREKLETKKELNAVELGHRKHLKHKSKKALDDFTTIQELLVHGNRDVHGKTYNALLSVTTV